MRIKPRAWRHMTLKQRLIYVHFFCDKRVLVRLNEYKKAV